MIYVDDLLFGGAKDAVFDVAGELSKIVEMDPLEEAEEAPASPIERAAAVSAVRLPDVKMSSSAVKLLLACTGFAIC